MNKPKQNIWYGVIYKGKTYWRMQAKQAIDLANNLTTDIFGGGAVATAFNAYTGEIIFRGNLRQ